MIKYGLALMLLLRIGRSEAEPIEFHSGNRAVPLLELYTSEGCSSCPPAEKWFSALKTNPKLWEQAVPVAFHVDYWDSLGWKDPLGSPDFSRRQRHYAAVWRSRSVYTPGFILSGREWRGWFDGDKLKFASGPMVGSLSARSNDGKAWTIRFEPAPGFSANSFRVFGSLLGFGIDSKVNAGENEGMVLKHDFAALALVDEPMRMQGDGFEAELLLKARTRLNARRLGFAAWITETGKVAPLQAVGGWLAVTSDGVK